MTGYPCFRRRDNAAFALFAAIGYGHGRACERLIGKRATALRGAARRVTNLSGRKLAAVASQLVLVMIAVIAGFRLGNPIRAACSRR